MKHIVLYVLFFCAAQIAKAQNYTIDQYNNATLTACSGTLFDSGGPNGNYQAGESYTITICPTIPGSGIRLDFTQFDLPNGSLCIYDGPTVAANQYGCFDNALTLTAAGASGANLSGCITLTFTSTGSGPGWAATITCVTPCQAINPELLGVLAGADVYSPPIPEYVDICPGEVVQVAAQALYPQNGTFYTQSDNTSTFAWIFGNGAQDSGQFVGTSYPNPGGFIIQLEVTDVNDCINTTFLSQKVRVAPDPLYYRSIIEDTICVGDTATLFGDAATPLVDFSPPTVFSDQLPLPDNVGIPYTTSINVQGYSGFATVLTPTDLQSLCVNMEHSFMGDLDITITCPTGQTIDLVNYPSGGGNTFIGEPNDFDDNPNPQVVGIGYDYCWEDAAPAGTWGNNANTFFQTFTDVSGNVYNNAAYLPAGTYAPDQSFAGLVGCPVNGTWTITITDNLGIDNGFIFNWGLTFNPNYLDPIYQDSFRTVIVDSLWLAAPGIVSNNADVLTVSPATAGQYTYTYQVTDNFGCVHDTTFTITVLPTGNLACLTCDSIFMATAQSLDTLCLGQTVQLNADVFSPLAPAVPLCDQYLVEPIPFAPVAGTPTLVPLNDDQLSGGLPIGFNFNFFCNTYSQFFISSNGFISFDGGAGTGCCAGQNLPDPFAPNNVIAAAWDDLYPPGNGTISYFTTGVAPNRQLVVDWTAIPFCCGPIPAVTSQIVLYETTNAIEVHVTSVDAITPGTIGIENANGTNGFAPANRNAAAWTATNEAWRFEPDLGNPFANAVYTWTPANTLNNPAAPTPVGAPTATLDYVVQAQWNNCIFNDTLPVTVLSLQATTLTCGNATFTEVTFNWTAVAGAVYYEVSLDGGLTWVNVGNVLTYLVTNLAPGQSVTIQVRPFGECPGPAATLTCTSTPCALPATVITCGTATNNTVTFDWTAVPGALNYEISLDGGATWTLVGNVLTYTWTGLLPGQTVTLLVRATDLSCAGPSATLSCTSLPCDLLTTGISCGVATTTSVTFDWTAVLNATGYEISTNGGATWVAVGNILTFTVSPLPPGQTANLLVRPINAQCTGPEASLNCTALPCPLLAPPVTCGASTGSSATFDWTAVAGASYYEISLDGGLTWVNIGNVLSYTANNLLPTQSVTIEFRAVGPDCSGPITTFTCAATCALSASAVQSSFGCAGQNSGDLNLSFQNNAGAVTFLWSNGSTDEDLSDLAPGNYTVTLTDASGCNVSVTTTVTELLIPSLDAWVGAPGQAVDTVFGGQPIELNAGFNEPGVTYTWAPATYLNSPTGNTVQATFAETGFFTFTVTAANIACSSNDEVSVVVQPSAFALPNAFTPNGDAKNPVFRPLVAGNAVVEVFKVFDRWGNLVFNDPLNGWDGTFKGEPLPRDVYIYVLQIRLPEEAQSRTLTGDVTLIR